MKSKFRKEIKVFADAMEYKLKKNDHKGGWENQTFDFLFKRLREEVDELEEALREGNFIDIMFEAADVANFAMMIAWNSLKGTTNEGSTIVSAGDVESVRVEKVAHPGGGPRAESSRAPMERGDDYSIASLIDRYGSSKHS